MLRPWSQQISELSFSPTKPAVPSSLELHMRSHLPTSGVHYSVFPQVRALASYLAFAHFIFPGLGSQFHVCFMTVLKMPRSRPPSVTPSLGTKSTCSCIQGSCPGSTHPSIAGLDSGLGSGGWCRMEDRNQRLKTRHRDSAEPFGCLLEREVRIQSLGCCTTGRGWAQWWQVCDVKLISHPFGINPDCLLGTPIRWPLPNSFGFDKEMWFKL